MTAFALKLDSTPDGFQEDFARHRAELPGAGLAWLDERRGKAMMAFAKTGLPTRRIEAWKYTDLANALDAALEPAKWFHGGISDEGPFALISGTRIALANGILHSVDRYPPDGMEIADLSVLEGSAPAWVKNNLGCNASGVDQPLGALSLGLMRGGVAVRVNKKGATLRLVFANPTQGYDWVGHSRVLVLVEEGASLTLLESHDSTNGARSFSNVGMEFVLKPGARLEHVRLHEGSESALHVTTIGVTLERDSEYRALYSVFGGRLSRVDANIRLDAQGARATVHNIAVLSDGIADTTTVMDHAKPHTTSRQLFKSAVGGRGRSVNQGRVTVREGAVKSDSHQLFKALLLSPRAEADAKPELEIFADDVVCGHGTAIGALDTDALFYLRSRGIPEGEARALLVRAFLGEAIEAAPLDVQEILWQQLDAGLASLEQSES